MKKDSVILIVGHKDIADLSLYHSLQSSGYTRVYSTVFLGLDPAIQPSVYAFFQEKRPEYIFLCSTRSGGIQANQDDAADFLYHNNESQNNIIYAAHKFQAKKVLFYASSCVYPKAAPQPMKEGYLLTGALEPTSEPYAVAKIAGIRLCQAYRRQYGLNAIVAVPATIYGPDVDSDLEKAHVLGALMAKFHRAVKDNQKEVVVWGSGKPRREFIYADDYVAASLFLLEHYEDEAMINMGVGTDISIAELAAKIAQITKFNGKIRFDSSKADGAPQKFLDSSRIKALGFKPKVNWEDGLKKTYEWYIQNQRKT